MSFTGAGIMLETSDIPATVEFYKEYLGFDDVNYYPDKENAVWCILVLGKAEIMFALPNEHMPNELPKLTGSVYLYTDNADEIWQKVKNKAKLVYEMEDFDYGMREFALYDNNGYMIKVGQEL